MEPKPSANLPVDLPIDLTRYFWALFDVTSAEISGVNPGERLAVDFKAKLPMDMITGTYYPEQDEFKFGFSTKVPDKVMSILKEKILQKIGYEYGS